MHPALNSEARVFSVVMSLQNSDYSKYSLSIVSLATFALVTEEKLMVA